MQISKKTTRAINAKADDSTEKLTDVKNDNPFSVATDGGASKSSQLYPVLVRYPNKTLREVATGLLRLLTTEDDCTGENIFDLVDKTIGLRWSND